MKVKAVISAALLCAFAISASGCDGADIGTDNLIRPPKTVGDEAEIEQLIAETAGISPKSVDNAVQRIRRKTAQQLLSGDFSGS